MEGEDLRDDQTESAPQQHAPPTGGDDWDDDEWGNV
jgi:hypothetical protein